MDRSEVLYLIQEEWKCGSIRPDRSDKTLKYEVRNIDALISTVVPHFKRFPLLSSKQTDFEKFARVCEAVSSRKHLQLEGFERIVRWSMQMNPSGKRKYRGQEILESLRLRTHRSTIAPVSQTTFSR